MEVALECIYNCERDDQLSLCYDILECLPQRGYGLDTTHTHTHTHSCLYTTLLLILDYLKHHMKMLKLTSITSSINTLVPPLLLSPLLPPFHEDLSINLTSTSFSVSLPLHPSISSSSFASFSLFHA